MNCTSCQVHKMTKTKGLSGEILCNKLDTFDWLKDIPDISNLKLVEVRFKNTRKDFYINSNNLKIGRGDYVAVETRKGHGVEEIKQNVNSFKKIHKRGINKKKQ